MKKQELDDMIMFCNSLGYQIKGTIIDTSCLVFEERIKMNCFYCAKYDRSWKCPPRIPQLDYKKIFSEYDYAALIYIKMPLHEKVFEEVRKNSSLHLHQAMLACERWLYQNNNATALSFIGGSCKLCKNGCTPEHCANPYQARMPIEALGVNIVKSAERYGIQITFPPKDFMMRIGLLLW